TVQKEIRMGLKIDTHDYETKRRNVEKFLDGGDKVKVIIRFRGREQARPERGVKLLQRMAEDVADYGFVESHPRQDGRNMVMVFGPRKRRARAVAEARRRRPMLRRPPPGVRTSRPIPRVGPRPAPSPEKRHKENRQMPKNKTHSGTKKRVRVTGSGKLMREKANARHLLEHKSSTRKRRLGSDTDVAKADVKRMKKLLGR